MRPSLLTFLHIAFLILLIALLTGPFFLAHAIFAPSSGVDEFYLRVEVVVGAVSSLVLIFSVLLGTLVPKLKGTAWLRNFVAARLVPDVKGTILSSVVLIATLCVLIGTTLHYELQPRQVDLDTELQLAGCVTGRIEDARAFLESRKQEAQYRHDAATLEFLQLAIEVHSKCAEGKLGAKDMEVTAAVLRQWVSDHGRFEGWCELVLAVGYRQAGSRADVEQALERIGSNETKSLLFAERFLLGELNLAAGHPGTAALDLETALTLAPPSLLSVTRLRLAEACIRDRNWQRAIELLTANIDGRVPDHAHATKLRGIAYLCAGQNQNASKDLERTAVALPETAYVRTMLAIAKALTDDRGEAIKYVDRDIRTEGDGKPRHGTSIPKLVKVWIGISSPPGLPRSTIIAQLGEALEVELTEKQKSSSEESICADLLCRAADRVTTLEPLHGMEQLAEDFIWLALKVDPSPDRQNQARSALRRLPEPRAR